MGAGIGNLVFSKAMRLTAQHGGMLILSEAGYDIRSAAQFHIRIMKFLANRCIDWREEVSLVLHHAAFPESRVE